MKNRKAYQKAYEYSHNTAMVDGFNLLINNLNYLIVKFKKWLENYFK